MRREGRQSPSRRIFIPYRHFVPLRLRGGRAPFVAIATFPPFHRGNLPRRRKRGLFLPSLRGSEATAAIPWSKVRGICCVFFQGDRHANARDDTGILPCYGFCKVLTQIYCADFGFLPRFTVLLGICAINSSWRFIYAAIFALIIYCGGALTSGSFKTDSPVALFFRSVCSSGRVLEKSFFPLDAELNLSIRSKSPNFSTV